MSLSGCHLWSLTYMEAHSLEPLPVPVTIPSSTAVESPHPRAPSSHPLPSTAVTPSPHKPSAPTRSMVGSSSCPLHNTSSAVVLFLGSVHTLGSSVHKVKTLYQPTQIPSYQEYLRQQAAQWTPNLNLSSQVNRLSLKVFSLAPLQRYVLPIIRHWSQTLAFVTSPYISLITYTPHLLEQWVD